MSLDGINGRVIDMTVELTNVEGREFKVDVAHNEEYTTTFTYYPEKHQIEIDRTYSGVNADVVCVRKIEIAEKHHLLMMESRRQVWSFLRHWKQMKLYLLVMKRQPLILKNMR